MNYQRWLYGFITTAFALSPVFPIYASETVQQSNQGFQWSGPYAGGFAGGAWGHSKVYTHTGTVNDHSYFNSPAIIYAVDLNGSGSPHLNSLIGGIQLGGNWTYKQLVYGLVFDYESFNQNKIFSATNIPYSDNSGNYSLETSISTNWLYTVRARLGLVLPRFGSGIVYASGGLASTRIRLINNFHDTTLLRGEGRGENQSSETGWIVGGGIEYPLTSNLTVNTEYRYVLFNPVRVVKSISNTLGSFGINPNSLSSPFRTTAKLNTNLITIGLNYKFSGECPTVFTR